MTAASAGEQQAPLTLPALLALCLLAPVAGIAHAGMSPVMPLIGEDFDHLPGSDLLVRLMMSGLSAAMILGALLSGLLAARLGTVRLLVTTLTIYGLSGAAIFLLDNLWLMLVCRLIQGVAVAAAGVLAMALITTRVPPARRDTWLGFYMVSSVVGIMLLFSAVGALAAVGWRYTFLLFLLALPLALLLAFALREGRPGEGAAQQTPPPDSAKPPIPLGLALFGVLAGAISAASPMYLPYHMAALGLGDAGTIAMMMVGGAAASGVTTLSFGLIRRVLSTIQVFVIGFSLNATALAIQALATGPEMILVGLVLAGIGLGMLMPNVLSACAATATAQWRARLLGFVRAGLHAGPLLVQPVLELVYRQSNAGMALLAIGIASAAGVAWVLLGRRQFEAAQ